MEKQGGLKEGGTKEERRRNMFLCVPSMRADAKVLHDIGRHPVDPCHFRHSDEYIPITEM